MPQPRFPALLQLALLAALLLAAAAQDPQLLPVQSNETGEGLRRDAEGRVPTSLLLARRRRCRRSRLPRLRKRRPALGLLSCAVCCN